MSHPPSTVRRTVTERGPPAEQKKRVETLVKADKARRKTDNIVQISVKQGRRGSGFDV